VNTDLAAALVSAALVGGFSVGRWWGARGFALLLAQLAELDPVAALGILARIRRAHKGDNA